MRPFLPLSFSLLVACALATAQGCTNRSGGAFSPPLQSIAHTAAAPSEILYVPGGAYKNKNIYINVIDGSAPGPTPSPLYTISPGAQWVWLGTNSRGELFLAYAVTAESHLLKYEPGQTKPRTACTLNFAANAMSVANDVIYVAGPGLVIYKYDALAADPCTKQLGMLTDNWARNHYATNLEGLTSDPAGDVFDSWVYAGPGNGGIDEFPGGGKKVRQLQSFTSTETFYLTADVNGNVIGGATLRKGIVLEVILNQGHQRKQFHMMSQGFYGGVALAKSGTELFVSGGSTVTTVQVYSYDPSSGMIGALLREYTNIWPYTQPIAVWSSS